MANQGINGGHTEVLDTQRQKFREHFCGIAMAPIPLPNVIADFDVFGFGIVEMVPTGADKLPCVACKGGVTQIAWLPHVGIVRNNIGCFSYTTGRIAEIGAHLGIRKLPVDYVNITGL